MLSKTSEYALRAVLLLARHPRGQLVRASDLAKGLAVPPNYLSKILHALSRAGVLVSERGRHGGFRLARPAERTALAEVIGPFHEITPRTQCLLGRSRCSDAQPCAAHGRWRDVYGPVNDFFHDTMVAELLDTSAEVAETWKP